MNIFKTTKASDDKQSFTPLVAATPDIATKCNSGTASSNYINSNYSGTATSYYCYQCGQWLYGYGSGHICPKQTQTYPYYVSPNINGIESKLERIAKALESLVHFESVKDLNAQSAKAKASIKKVLKKKKK